MSECVRTRFLLAYSTCGCRGDTRPARGSKLKLTARSLRGSKLTLFSHCFARTVDGYHPSIPAAASQLKFQAPLVAAKGSSQRKLKIGTVALRHAGYVQREPQDCAGLKRQARENDDH